MHFLRKAIAMLVLASCGHKDPGPPIGISGVARDNAPSFNFDSLDQRPVSAAAMHGKVAVIVFVTTYDLASQADVDFIVPIAKQNDPSIAFAMVALQSNTDRELVEHYADTLGVKFPVAMSDVQSASSVGFGTISVPTVVVLDAAGKLVFRKEGIVKNDELHRAIDAASSSKP